MKPRPALRQAEEALVQAKATLAAARVELDLQLAGEGWTVIRGGFASDDPVLYQRAGDAMSATTLTELLARLEVA